MKTVADVFSEIYATHGKKWKGLESASGRGSDTKTTETIRIMLPKLLKAFDVKFIIDAGCGDWNWMRQVRLGGIKYLGIDVVKPMIETNNAKYASKTVEFVTGDLTIDTLPKADLILCRSVLFHLSYDNLQKAVRNFWASGAKWLLTTTFPNHEEPFADIENGSFHLINLQRHPFSWPAPYMLIPETESHIDGWLGLWPNLEERRRMINGVDRNNVLEKTAHILTWLKDDEKLALYDAACEVPAGGHIVETGTLYGGSAAILACGAPQADIITMDKFGWHPDGYPTPSKQLARQNLDSINAKNVTIREEDTTKAVHDGSPIDLLWIDGGHDFDVVYHDLVTFGPFAKVIVMHDFSNKALPGVRKAFDKFKKTFVQRYVASEVGYLAVIRKMPLDEYKRRKTK